MALIKGICKNFGECDMADNKEIQEVDKTNFVCEECGKPLHPVDGSGGGSKGSADPSKSKRKFIVIIAAAVLAVAGAGYGIWSLVGGSSDPLDKIAKIELSKEKITLLVDGKPKTVKAIAMDKDGKEIKDVKVTYQWTIDNSDIATVTQEGEIAAVKEGDATVTVTINGRKQDISATCEVNVKEAPSGSDTLIEKIHIADAKDFTLKKGGTKKLEYKAEPADHSETVNWESSDPSVATVSSSGLVSAVGVGTATIKALSDKSMKEAVVKVTVTIDDGPLRLSYGTYTGQIKKGYPNGQGRLVYSKSRQINKNDPKGRMANPGDVVQGTFVNGFFTIGKHYDASGNLIESLNIGSPVEGVFESK